MKWSIPAWQMVVFLGIPAAMCSFVLCWVMRIVSPRVGYVDRPGGRKDHGRVMPYGGGVAIFLTFILLILSGLVLVLSGRIGQIPSFQWLTVHEPGIYLRINQMAGILFGGFILLVLGLFDDVKDLGPWFKLAIEFAVAGMVVIGFDVRLSLFIQGVSFGWIVSVLWLVVLINAFNFLDNADGLSSGVALICTTVLLGTAIVGGQVFVSAFLACLAGALLGFLIHNFPPARIFLGDAGSLVIGYLMGVGSLLTTFYNERNPETSKFSVLIPLIVMAIPLYDFFSVIVIRWLAGDSPFKADHRHFSHRLRRRGLSPLQMVLTVYLATGGTAVGAIMLRHLSGLPALLIFLQTLCIVAIIGILEYQPSNYGNGSQ